MPPQPSITKSIVTIIILALIGFGMYQIRGTAPVTSTPVVESNPKNATYRIEGMPVTLKNGISEIPAAPGSASMITTQYFGNELKHDFDGDDRDDTAFILTQNTGGTGTFYYVVIALNTVNGYVGSDAFLLGDRIAPQPLNMSMDAGKGNILVANYVDRNPGESFAISPSVGKSKWILLDPKTMQLGEVTQNFEGEANPSRMSLDMHAWKWINTTYNDGRVITPRVENKFILTFKPTESIASTFSASTDCNGVGGEYHTNGATIVFDKMMSTQMYCEGSQEADFTKGITEVQSYHFTSKGELVFDLKFDSGTMLFR